MYSTMNKFGLIDCENMHFYDEIHIYILVNVSIKVESRISLDKEALVTAL